ncbi:MAG: hypothetical protein QOH71_3828 [Blastocatellia bacterium]|jgi:hypothetical protein|nr:hypothetical protein [Blastocatellia bacterium]
MANNSFFGVGCFHFWPAGKAPFIFEMERYISDLRAALESVPAISNIQIDFDEETPSFQIENDLTELSDGEDFLPVPAFLEIRFDIYIPFRIQQVLASDYTPEDTLSESFRVNIQYAYDAPVCFVEPLNPTGVASASDAVQVVREYLNQQINSLGKAVRFDSIGPSPFHADFSLHSRPNADYRGFQVEHDRNRGYDKIRFFFSEHEFESVDSAKEELFSNLTDELGLYYQLMLSRAKGIHEWEKIENVLSKLFDAWGKRSLRQRFANVFLQGWYINKLITAIVSLEADQLFRKNSVDERYRSIYSKNEQTFIPYFIDNGIKELSPYPTKQISDLALFLEGRRSRALELLVVLLASLTGGVAGSLFTILLAKNH